MTRLKTVMLLLLTVLLLAGCWGNTPQPSPSATIEPTEAPTAPPTPEPTVEPTPTPTPEPTPTPTPEPTPTPQPVEISLMAVGDIMCHGAQVAAAYNSKTKTHDFTNSFQYIKDIISSADLAIGNLECPLGGPKKPYSEPNSKNFSAPDTMVDALKDAGFDILSSANNHITNRGTAGMLRTPDVIREKGLASIGVRTKTDENWHYITEVKGVKIGFTAYTYGVNTKDSSLLHSFSPSNVTASLEEMKTVIDQMRADGAEIIVFHFHWGSEYSRKAASSQAKIAKGLADLGVDIVLGSHPHVIQTVEMIHSEKSGKDTFVAYSMGNFISNQLARWNSNFLYTEDSFILNVRIVKQPDGSPAKVAGAEYLPTRTMMVTVNGKRMYTVIPLEKAIAAPEAYNMTAAYDKKRSAKSLADTNKLLADAVAKGFVKLMELPQS